MLVRVRYAAVQPAFARVASARRPPRVDYTYIPPPNRHHLALLQRTPLKNSYERILTKKQNCHIQNLENLKTGFHVSALEYKAIVGGERRWERTVRAAWCSTGTDQHSGVCFHMFQPEQRQAPGRSGYTPRSPTLKLPAKPCWRSSPPGCTSIFVTISSFITPLTPPSFTSPVLPSLDHHTES